MYTHKISNHFRFLKSLHQLKNLLFRKHDGAESFRFQHIPASSLASYTDQSGGFYENKKLPHYDLPKINKEVAFRKWRNNWKSYITSEIGSFIQKAENGVCDVTVKLSNKTTENVDYVQVKVLYFEESGKLYKSEYSEVFGIKPLSTINVPVYDSPKGSVVNVHITQVVAKAFNFEYCQGSYE